MSSFANAVHAQINAPHQLSAAMEQFVGQRVASRREIITAINTYAADNGLYREDRMSIKPDLLLASLLRRPAAFHIGDMNALISRHLTPREAVLG
jgi:chromatin remodeling complex protein RSC6